MRIQFSPALGEIARIPISDSRISSDAVVLQFRASVGKDDYAKIERGGAKVQLWSNLPDSDAKSESGGWRALDFAPAAAGASHVPPSNGRHTTGPVRWLNLASSSQGQSISEGILVLQLPLDLSSFTGEQTFQFTYRVLFSDGSITWLGSHGFDGAVVLIGSKLPDVELKEGWRFATDVGGNGFIYPLPDTDAPEQAIAKVANPDDYQVWAVDRHLYLRSSTLAVIRDVQLMIMIPRTQQGCFNQPAYVLSATQGAVLSASPATGTASVAGVGSVLFQSCYDVSTHLRTLVQSALVYSGVSERVRLVHQDHNQWLLILSPREQSPTKGILIPTESTRGSGHVRVDFDIASLAKILTSPLKEGAPPQFCIFSPLTYALEFLDTRNPPELETTDDVDLSTVVAFSVPSSGGEFTLSKVYGSETVGTKVAILSPYSSVSQSGGTGKAVVLPTPPPSPQLRPERASRSQQSVVTFSPQLTIIPPVESVTAQNSNGASTHTGRGSFPNRNQQIQSTRGFLGLIKHLYSAFSSIFGGFFYFLLLGPLWKGNARGDSKVTGGIQGEYLNGGERVALVDEPEPLQVEESQSSSGEDDPPLSPPSVEQNGGALTGTTSPTQGNSEQELLSAEICPNLDQETHGRVWAKLVLVVSGPRNESNGSIEKAVTLNGSPPDQLVARFLKEDKPRDAAYYCVEFAVPDGTAKRLILKVLDIA